MQVHETNDQYHWGTSFREFCQELEPRYRIPKIPIQVVMYSANTDIGIVPAYVFFSFLSNFDSPSTGVLEVLQGIWICWPGQICILITNIAASVALTLYDMSLSLSLTNTLL